MTKITLGEVIEALESKNDKSQEYIKLIDSNIDFTSEISENLKKTLVPKLKARVSEIKVQIERKQNLSKLSSSTVIKDGDNLVNVEIKRKRSSRRRLNSNSQNINVEESIKFLYEELIHELEKIEFKVQAPDKLDNLKLKQENSNAAEVEKSSKNEVSEEQETEVGAREDSIEQSKVIQVETFNFVDEALEEKESGKKAKNKKGKANDYIKAKKTNLNEIIKYGIKEIEEEGSILPESIFNTQSNEVIVKKKTIQFQNIHKFQKPQQKKQKVIEIFNNISVEEIAKNLSIKLKELIKKSTKIGLTINYNDTLDIDTASLLLEELKIGYKIINIEDKYSIQAIINDNLQDENSKQIARAPVVVVMGHVDHGKTSLLDFLRKTNVVDGEHGKITQHIGAYNISTSKGNITFLDTPGHSAFTAMRARGAKITDIVILIVAADDGVKTQTIEAIQHAKAAEVPIIVAINKIDKPDANVDNIKRDLASHGVLIEEWGGEIQCFELSAKTGKGIPELIDGILLNAEILELQATVDIPANGVIIESSLDKTQGKKATLLIQNGVLKKSDIVVCETTYGKIRLMVNDCFEQLKEVFPSIPVELFGFNELPEVGQIFTVVESEKKAKEINDFHINNIDNQVNQQINLETLFDSVSKNKDNVLPVLVKADVNGSLEAIKSLIQEIKHDEVNIKIMYSGIGGITLNDINLAISSNALVFGFNVRAENAAKNLAELKNVDIRYYGVIYDLIDNLKDSLSGKLSPLLKESVLGIAEVRDIFNSPKFGKVVGCMVTKGKIIRGKKVRVVRNDTVIHEGILVSLRRHKDNVNEVEHGLECGIGIKNYNDIQLNDYIEVFEQIEEKRRIE